MAGHHARRAPSKSDTWAVCADSLNATAHLKDSPNVFGAEGNVLHDIAALCLETGLEPYDFLDQIRTCDGFSFVITEERARWVEMALSVVKDLPGEMHIETRVDLGNWLPGDFGRLDVGFITPDVITVIDFKFGMARIYPTTRQIKLYLLGFWWMIARHVSKATRFRAMIVQPRVSGGGGEIWLTLDELLAFGEEIRAAGERTLDPNATRTASDRGCFGCLLSPERGGPGCDTLTEFMLQIACQTKESADEAEQLGFPPALPPADGLDRDHVSFLLKHEKMFTRWLKAVREIETGRAEVGASPPGLKVIDGDMGDREWADPLLAESKLIDVLQGQAFNRKLKSPSQAEKELKPTRKKAGHPVAWGELQALIVRADGKPLLVPVEDTRPERKSVHLQFDEVENSDDDLIG